MDKFAKVIDVDGVEGISQILIYVQQNEDSNYVCTIFTHLPQCEIKISLNTEPKDEDDNCYEAAIKIFNNLSNAPEMNIVNCIISTPIYKHFFDTTGAVKND